MFVLNLVVVMSIVDNWNDHLIVGHICRLIILILIVPQFIYMLISLRTSIRIIQLTPRMTLHDKISELAHFRQLGMVLQMLAVYELVFYPISCLLLSLNLPSIRRIINSVPRVLWGLIKSYLYMFAILVAVLLATEAGDPNVRPINTLEQALT